MNKKNETVLDKLSGVVFMWIAVGFGTIAVLFMFLPALLKTLDLGGIYGVVDSTKLFFQPYDEGAGWPIFVGYMLLVVGVLLTIFIALPFFDHSYEKEKKVLLIAIICFVVGALIIFFTKPIYLGMKGKAAEQFYLNPSYAGPYLAGAFGIVAAGLDIFALNIDK